MIPILKACNVDQDYTPTKEDLKRLQVKKNHFKLSGDGVFYTIQGEGNTTGRPAIFVRLHFCNLSCHWCDSWYTWHQGSKEYYQEPFDVHIDDLETMIIDVQKEYKVQDFCKNIVFTGGEPLLQQDVIENFIKKYPDFVYEIETNGTIMPSAYLRGHAKFNCSPKLSSSRCRDAINDVSTCRDVLEIIESTKNPCFKFVCQTKQDIEEVWRNFSFLKKENVYIMPEGVTAEENQRVFKSIMPHILQYGFRVSLRAQNVMFDGAKRAV